MKKKLLRFLEDAAATQRINLIILKQLKKRTYGETNLNVLKLRIAWCEFKLAWINDIHGLIE